MICVLHMNALEFYLVSMSRRRFASIIFSVTNVHVSCPHCTRKCLHIYIIHGQSGLLRGGGSSKYFPGAPKPVLRKGVQLERLLNYISGLHVPAINFFAFHCIVWT